MGKLEYTQGKWSYRQKRGNNIYEHQVLCDNRIVIAELDGEDFEIKGSNDLSKASEIKANAKLIAAAPDLLNVVLQFIHSVEHEGVIEGRVVDAVRNAKEAIQKATNG